MIRRLLLIMYVLLNLVPCSNAQGIPVSTADRPLISDGFLNEINNRYTSLEDRFTRQSLKYLERLKKREAKLEKQLQKIDSAAAHQLFTGTKEQYARLESKLADSNKTVSKNSGDYFPYVDSVKTSLVFLQQNNQFLTKSNETAQKVKGSLAQVNQLQHKMGQSEEVKAFIQQRKQQINDALKQYNGLPTSITRNVKSINKDIYYYSQQIQEYKNILKAPDKMVVKALELLNKFPAFEQFMRQHSELAGLFSRPQNYGTSQSLAGLQTRAIVQQQIQNQLVGAGPNAQQYMQQNLQAAQAQLSQLKDKINKLGAGNGDMEMPDFKPNTQRTKSFWNRLEYGTSFQTVKNNFYPATTDLGLSVGYKINDKSSIGIGASYKVGWGNDIRKIAVTQQGMGLRSYLDVKVKGSFYASGGFEYNYQPLTLETTGPLPGPWQQSGLLGISKIVSLQSKLFKKTKLQLLWDFLSYREVPASQPIKFRIGYNIK